MNKLVKFSFAAIILFIPFFLRIPLVSAASAPMCIDTPSNGSYMTTQMSFSGWAINTSGVKKVDIYIDSDYYVGSATIGAGTIDIQANNPSYPISDISTYSLNANLNVSAFSVRTHTLKVVATGYDGSTNSQTTNIVNVGPIMNIENPSSNYDSRVNNTVTIGGWALAPDGISNVTVSVDGSQNPSLRASISGSSLYYRSDVQSQNPSYPNASANRGFSASFDINKICAGTHTAFITLTTGGGRTTTRTKTFTVTKPSSHINIDTPLSGSYMTNKLSISGWAINPSGVSTVDVFIDGNYYVGRATVGPARGDVVGSHPDYPIQDISTFSMTANLNLGAFSNIDHPVTVNVTGNDGSVITQTITITKRAPIFAIDAPSSGKNYDSRVNSSVDVAGYAMAIEGVRSVTVSVDGSSDPNLRTTIAGSSLFARPDIQTKYSNTPGVTLNTGYSTSFDINKIPPGQHTVFITLLTNGGDTITNTKIINVSKPSNHINVDTPVTATYMSKDMVINGWAINASTVKSVDVYLNNSIYLGSASLGPARSDVASKYPSYLSSQISTFQLVAHPSLQNYPGGNYTLTVYVTGMDGTKTSESIIIRNADSFVHIDTPAAYSNYNSGDLITLKGWANCPEGFTNVTVKGDGVDVGAGVIFNQTSNQVQACYPQYPDSGHSAFTAYVNASAFSNGIHIITVTATDSQGYSTSSTVAITIGASSFTRNYSISLRDMVTKQQQILTNDNIYSITVTSSDLDPNVIGGIDNGYAFMQLEYGGSNLTAAQLETMILDMSSCYTKDTHQRIPDILKGHAQDFIDAANQYNINPLYLVAHAREETGNGGSTLATGQVEPDNGVTYYNMFGIGAIDSDPLHGGLTYAYQHGWSTVRSAIMGGAQWISEYYVNSNSRKQDTLYKMKWNPSYVSTYGTDSPHEYATDPNWPENIADYIYANWVLISESNMTIVFDIPSYSN